MVKKKKQKPAAVANAFSGMVAKVGGEMRKGGSRSKHWGAVLGKQRHVMGEKEEERKCE